MNEIFMTLAYMQKTKMAIITVIMEFHFSFSVQDCQVADQMLGEVSIVYNVHFILILESHIQKTQSRLDQRLLSFDRKQVESRLDTIFK